MAATIRYLVFDIESAADGELVAKTRYGSDKLTPAQATRRYRDELMEKHDSDFIPYTYQIPVSVCIAKVGKDYQLEDLVALDEPQFRPHVITEHFWRGWERYQCPTLVSFNGRGFDIPLMELAAFRFGLNVPRWFDTTEKSFAQPRNRFNLDAHLDLHEVLTNFGSSRFTGGLNLAANLIGKPGKMETQGNMVQDLYEAGKLEQINDYCRCDVLDTYFVFLRTRVLVGDLDLKEEQQIIIATKEWLKKRSEVRAYRDYLNNWGDWQNPWSKK